MSHSQPKRVRPSDPNFEEVVLEWFNAESEGDDDPADSDADAICSEHSSDSEVSSLSSQDEDDQDETFGGKPAALEDKANPNWIPNQNLGYISIVQPSSSSI
ncbi:hypothetical protein FQA39_LY18497 [Lamprigera yunnana]|nr:hypothetical protein FQA39_LY18497 [Lamprigera yunnana]